MPHPFRPRSPLCDSHAEELASALTHALGTALSAAALVTMLIVASGDAFKTAAAAIFGSTLVLLYLSSTLYHALSSPQTKRVLQTVDHACIYLLIAGSYTPLALVSLRGPWGWSILATVWTLAIAGILTKSLRKKTRDGKISTAIYLLMGWLIVVAIKPVLESLPPVGFAWIAAGGLCYTLGTVFFAWKNLHFNHAIWHLFVLAGSLCHIVATTAFILDS